MLEVGQSGQRWKRNHGKRLLAFLVSVQPCPGLGSLETCRPRKPGSSCHSIPLQLKTGDDQRAAPADSAELLDPVKGSDCTSINLMLHFRTIIRYLMPLLSEAMLILFYTCALGNFGFPDLQSLLSSKRPLSHRLKCPSFPGPTHAHTNSSLICSTAGLGHSGAIHIDDT